MSGQDGGGAGTEVSLVSLSGLKLSHARIARTLIWLAALLLLLPDFGSIPPTSDGQVDYLILRAGWDGGDPTVPTIELARRYDLLGWYTVVGVARAPGFFITNAAQILNLEAGLWGIRVLNAAAVVFIGWLASRMWQVRWWTVSIPVLFLGWGGFTWTTADLFWAAMICWTWMLADRSDGWLVGLPLGFAVGVRVWPAVLVLALLALGRPKSAAAAAGVATALTSLGLSLPGVTLEGTVRSLTETGFPLAKDNNLSVSTLLSRVGVPTGLTIALGVAGLIWGIRRMGVRRGYGIAVVGGLMLSPIFWFHYLTASALMWPSFFSSRHTPPLRDPPSSRRAIRFDRTTSA